MPIHALVYASRAQKARAFALIQRHRDAGRSSAWRDTKGYRGEVEPCGTVYTDVDNVRAAYEAAGVEVEPLTVLGCAPSDIPAPAPAAEGGDPESTPVPQRRQRRRR